MNQPYRTYTPNKRNVVSARTQRPSPSPANSPVEEPGSRFTTPPPPAILPHASPSSPSSHSLLSTKSNQVPFRPGFQARGIYRDRTNELLKLRNPKQESKRLEESRLQKRLEKLIELHFPFQPSLHLPAGPSNPPSDSLDHQNHSSILHLSHTLIGIAKHLTNQSTEPEPLNLINQNQSVRLKEQSIVRWQDDNEVKECKFCQSPFGLRVRKHHCRLCGSIVCFNPTWATGRPERCSTMIRFEWDPNFKSSSKEKNIQGKIIQLTEQEIGTIDQPHSSLLELISPQPNHAPNNQLPNTAIKPKKAVRVCSHCLAIILRRQAMTSPPQIPHYLHIYSSLKRLQDQIELALPEFQELVTSSKHSARSNLNPKSGSNPPTPAKLLTIRKKLLTNLTLFDSYSKELSSKLTENNSKSNSNGESSNGSEIRLIKAITTRAGLFLRDHMSLIRSLGLLDSNPTPTPTPVSIVKKSQLQEHVVNHSRTTSQQQELTAQELLHERTVSIDSRTDNDPVGSRNHEELIKLNVLLEQELLIESYLLQARQKRQLEDVASLTVSLNDLREEIANLKKSLL